MTLFANHVDLPLEAVTDIEHNEVGTLLTLNPAKAHDIVQQFGHYAEKMKLWILIWDGLYGDAPSLMSLVVMGVRRMWGNGVYDLKPTANELHIVTLMRDIHH